MSLKNWYVVQTKPRKEKLAEVNLQRQGFVTYCPHTVRPKRRRQHWQRITEPLFPRYLFVELNSGVDNFSPIRSTFGVIGLVCFGNQPAQISSVEIATIYHQERLFLWNARAVPNLQMGDVVEIASGPFAGLKGVFEKTCSNERVMVLLNLLGRKNQVTVDIDDVVPVASI